MTSLSFFFSFSLSRFRWNRACIHTTRGRCPPLNQLRKTYARLTCHGEQSRMLAHGSADHTTRFPSLLLAQTHRTRFSKYFPSCARSRWRRVRRHKRLVPSHDGIIDTRASNRLGTQTTPNNGQERTDVNAQPRKHESGDPRSDRVNRWSGGSRSVNFGTLRRACSLAASYGRNQRISHTTIRSLSTSM